MTATDQGETFLEVSKGLLCQLHLLLRLSQVDPPFGSIDCKGELRRVIVCAGGLVVCTGCMIKITEPSPEVDFPASAKGQSVRAGGKVRSGPETGADTGGGSSTPDSREAIRPARDGAFPRSAQSVCYCLQVVILPEGFLNEASHPGVVKL